MTHSIQLLKENLKLERLHIYSTTQQEETDALEGPWSHNKHMEKTLEKGKQRRTRQSNGKRVLGWNRMKDT